LNEEGEIEWRFSPRYSWNDIPEEIKQEITKYNLKWDWFGNYLPQELRNPEHGEPVRTSFFIIYSKSS
jgi:hypothetical protein